MGKSSPSFETMAVKPRKSIKTTPGDVTRLTKDVNELRTFYGDVLASWHLLTEAQKAETLTHSPILARLKSMTDPLRG